MNIQLKKKVDPNNKSSDCNTVIFQIFFLDLELQANNKDIYDLENMCYHKIKVERPRQ